MLDTSVLIRFEKMYATGQTTLLESSDDLSIAAITLSEILVGVHRSDTRRRPMRQQFVDYLLERLIVLPFDQPVAVFHAALVASLRSSGLTIGNNDMMIAATAIFHGFHVMTLDRRSFPHIPGIRLLAVP